MPQHSDASCCLDVEKGRSLQGEQRRVGEHSPGDWESDAGSDDTEYCLRSIYSLDTFLHNSEIVDIFVFISALQIRKLVLKEGKRLIHSVRQGMWLRRQTDVT